MKQNTIRSRREALDAIRQLGGGFAAPAKPRPVAAPDWQPSPLPFAPRDAEPVAAPEPEVLRHATQNQPAAEPDLSRHVTQKAKGRPPGGIRQAARDAGVPEATYRRRLRLAGASPDVIAAPVSNAAKLRVIASRDAKEALDREAAKAGKRGPSALALLRAENASLLAAAERLRTENAELRERVERQRDRIETLNGQVRDLRRTVSRLDGSRVY